MATADDAKRVVRGLVRDMQREAYHAGATHRPNSELATPLFPARAALLRAADGMIEALAWYARMDTPHEDVSPWAKDALARVAAMGEGRDA